MPEPIQGRDELERRLKALAHAFRAMAEVSRSRVDDNRARLIELAVQSGERVSAVSRKALLHRQYIRATIDQTQNGLELAALALVTPKSGRPWLTVADLAKLLGHTKPTIRQMCRNRGIALHRVGNKDLIDPKELNRIGRIQKSAQARAREQLLLKHHATKSEKNGK